MKKIIQFFIELHQFFDGKKTLIGGYLLTIAVVFQEFGVGILELKWAWIPLTIKSLNWIGMFLGGSGAGHKIAKYFVEKKAEAAAEVKQ